jgi:N-acetylmuramic acid 6-phosphate etherase
MSLFLGIEGGGTRTIAVLANAAGGIVRRIETGPANLRLLSDCELTDLLGSIAAAVSSPNAVCIGLAGARTGVDRERIRQAAAKAWPSIPCRATDDLEIALAAAEVSNEAAATILIVSGTGSCCYGRNRRGLTAKVGGWGHVLGDSGSGYDIGLRALRAVVAQHDETGILSKLGRQFLRLLQLFRPDDLISWAQAAPKSAIAALAETVFEAAAKKDRLASAILDPARDSLAEQAICCAKKLAPKGSRVEFVFTGSVLTRRPAFARQLGNRLRSHWPQASASVLDREGAWGAANLARQLWQQKGQHAPPPEKLAVASPAVEKSRPLPPTEQRNPRSANLPKMPLARAIELMLSEDAKIPRAILRQRKAVERAVQFIVAALKRGGRLFYVGAGTSGRLGVLDASECPPTFGVPPETVQGIIAGGLTALTRAVEGAEDDSQAGAQALRARNVLRRDVVVGISASGRAPFVWGALDEAARVGAVTILLCFNPFAVAPGHRRPRLVIAPQLGPEVLAGSTRLKAGTATKLILNIFTTLAMARSGRVSGNLMSSVNPSNLKLRERATRILQDLCGVSAAAARRALEESGWQMAGARARLAGSKKV